MTEARGELAGAIRDAALLEGEFLLRSGRRSSYYLDKYRFATRPERRRKSPSSRAASRIAPASSPRAAAI